MASKYLDVGVGDGIDNGVGDGVDNNDSNSSFQCVICSDNAGSLIKNNLCNNNCQFHYHIKCYSKWQKTSSNTLCIMCRKPIISFLDDVETTGMDKNCYNGVDNNVLSHPFRNYIGRNIDNNEHVAINVRRHFNFNNPIYYYDEVVYADDINNESNSDDDVDGIDDAVIIGDSVNVLGENTHFRYHTLNGGSHQYRIFYNRSNELGKQFCKIFCCIFFLFPLIYQIIYLASLNDN